MTDDPTAPNAARFAPVTDPDLVVRPLVEPSFSRTIYLATVRGRPHSPAVGAFVQEARRYPWPATRLAA